MASYELLNCQLPVRPKGLEAFTNSALPTEGDAAWTCKQGVPGELSSPVNAIFVFSLTSFYAGEE